MKKSTALSILLPLLFILGCREDNTPVQVTEPLSPEEQTIANCYTVQQAAEDFAAANSGAYPSNTMDTNLNGDTIIDLLPGGTKLENPFTTQTTEPGDGVAILRGETRYFPAIEENVIVNYTITGVGAIDLIIVMTSDTTVVTLNGP